MTCAILAALQSRDLSIITSLFSGHNPLKMTRVASDICGFCSEHIETTELIMCDCVAYLKPALASKKNLLQNFEDRLELNA